MWRITEKFFRIDLPRSTRWMCKTQRDVFQNKTSFLVPMFCSKAMYNEAYLIPVTPTKSKWPRQQTNFSCRCLLCGFLMNFSGWWVQMHRSTNHMGWKRKSKPRFSIQIKQTNNITHTTPTHTLRQTKTKKKKWFIRSSLDLEGI